MIIVSDWLIFYRWRVFDQILKNFNLLMASLENVSSKWGNSRDQLFLSTCGCISPSLVAYGHEWWEIASICAEEKLISRIASCGMFFITTAKPWMGQYCDAHRNCNVPWVTNREFLPYQNLQMISLAFMFFSENHKVPRPYKSGQIIFNTIGQWF